MKFCHKLLFQTSKATLYYKDLNATDTFKAQKGSKDIIKIANVTSVVQP